MTLGAIYYAFNSPGCMLWAKVLKSGRVFIVRDFKFVRQPIETVVDDVMRQTAALGLGRLTAVYAVPEMFPKPSRDTRRSLEAEAPSQTFARFGLPLVASGGDRVHGWQRIHEFLRDAPDGRPWIVLSPECKWLRRTLPTLVQTKSNPDDCDGELYAAHALRALLSSRPQPSSTAPKPTTYDFLTLGWLKRRDQPTQRGVLAR